MTNLILKSNQICPINIEIEGLGLISISRNESHTYVEVKSKIKDLPKVDAFYIRDISFFHSYFTKLQNEAELFDISLVVEGQFASDAFDDNLSIDEALISLLHDTVFDFTTLTPLKGRYYSDPAGLVKVIKNTSAPHFCIEPSVQELIKKNGTHFYQTNGGKVLVAMPIETDGEPGVNFLTLKKSYAEEVLLNHANETMKESGPASCLFMIDGVDSVSLPGMSALGWDVGFSQNQKFCFSFSSEFDNKDTGALELTLNFDPLENKVTLLLEHLLGRKFTKEASTLLHTNSLRDEILLLVHKIAKSSSSSHFVRSAKANDPAFTKLLAAAEELSKRFPWPESKIEIGTLLDTPYAELLNRGSLSHDELKQFTELRWVCYQDSESLTDLELESSFFVKENSMEYYSLDALLTFNWEERKLSLTFGLNLGDGFNEYAQVGCDDRPLNVIFDEMIERLKREDVDNLFLLKFTEHELAGKVITDGLRAASVALGLE